MGYTIKRECVLCLSFLVLVFNCRADEEDLASLPEYTFVATKTERSLMKVPGSITVADFDRFEKEGTANIGDLVSYQTGISIPFEYSGQDAYVPYRGSGYTNYRIRGVGGNRILLTIDGIRLPPQVEGSGGNGRDYFDPAVFQRLEILRGSGSTLYGSDALGGVVTFETRSLKDELLASGKPRLLYNQFGYKDVNDEFSHIINAATRSERCYFELSHALRSGHETQNEKGETPRNPENHTSRHALVKLNYTVGSMQDLTFTAENFVRDQDVDLDSVKGVVSQSLGGYTDTFFAATKAEDERTRYSLKYEETSGDRAWESLNVQCYFQSSETNTETDTKTNYSNGVITLPSRDRTDQIRFLHNSWGGSVECTYAFEWMGFAHTLVSGIETSFEYSENRFHRIDRQPSYLEKDRPSFDSADVNRLDVFLQDVAEKGKWLFQCGVRLGYYQLLPENDPEFLSQSYSLSPAEDYSNVSLSPSASIQYELNDEIAFWVRYAGGIRNPGVEDYLGFFDHSGGGVFFRQIPNTALQEEICHSFDVGLKWATGLSEMELTAYRNAYEGFISMEDLGPDPDNPGYNLQQSQNIGDVVITGLDFRWDRKLDDLSEAFADFRMGLSCSLSNGKNKTTDDNVNSVDPFKAVSYIKYDSSGPGEQWGLGLYGTYRAKKKDTTRLYEASGLTIPPESFVLDLNGYWALSDTVTVNAGIRNLTDQKYWIWGSTDSVDHGNFANREATTQPGINGFVSVKIKL